VRSSRGEISSQHTAFDLQCNEVTVAAADIGHGREPRGAAGSVNTIAAYCTGVGRSFLRARKWA
jgi:hypothetical protein